MEQEMRFHPEHGYTGYCPTSGSKSTVLSILSDDRSCGEKTVMDCFMKRHSVLFLVLVALCIVPAGVWSQPQLVKVLVSTPAVQLREYTPIADVIAGCIIRELKQEGGLEIINNEKAERYLREQGMPGRIAGRKQAAEVGGALGADIVIFSALTSSYDTIIYTMIFFEVKRDIIQRVIKGDFKNSTSASGIGRIMKEEVAKLKKYIPLPSELADPGMMIRDTTIDPDNLPTSHEIEDFPISSRYGVIESLFTFYRVFPGDLEYYKFSQGTRVMRFRFRDDLDEELTKRLNTFNLYADFAIRHGFQAFIIKDCSTQAINVLVANDIPVFYVDDLILGYDNLLSDGYCWFRTLSNDVFDTTEMSHRNRMLVLIIVPKPGKKGGISKDYLQSGIGRYENEWDKAPELVEVKEGMLDLSTVFE